VLARLLAGEQYTLTYNSTVVATSVAGHHRRGAALYADCWASVTAVATMSLRAMQYRLTSSHNSETTTNRLSPPPPDLVHFIVVSTTASISSAAVRDIQQLVNTAATSCEILRNHNLLIS